MQTTIARSYLFVPANRPERFAKACAAGADAVIVDLEDAVPSPEKIAARNALAAWLSPAQPVLVRINSADSAWFRDDLALCALAGVSGIVLPKAEHLDQIDAIAALRPDIVVLPLIETARGFSNADQITRHQCVQRLMFGAIDFQFDLGIDGDTDALLYFRSQLVLLSRLAGIQAPVDGVTTAINDSGRLRVDTLYARRLGFGGKLCIHPNQIVPVNNCFYPSAEEVAWAQQILAAASAARGAAVAVDGKMVDLPVMRKAQKIIDEAAHKIEQEKPIPINTNSQ
ncbi:MAG: CoA ester lyase [Glaciimonas sp.]|nr:CoA ester lyase [Glaciimonas sp.]